MANKQIPLKDKQVVMQRLAEGQSTRQAIAGTAIASNQTAARIAKQESHAIAQYRDIYLREIERAGGDIRARAWVLGKMVQANKTIRVPPPRGSAHNRVHLMQVEDWDARLKAIQYIDQLAGASDKRPAISVNVIQQQVNKAST